ncbi:SLOG domain-containing protein [Salinibacterium sp. PAMC 21357]|uniref:SLOG domain-containing protein n=1 Tax=Salinibacterium sp. PAMC 21357 TaxID=1112215 RepID=UPI0002888922|nr:hypothetical protein [Salinibacterium sp. PAMC 21357]
MTSLVFLSASFPTLARRDEAGDFFPPDIAAATAAVVEATLRSGATLIYGGHPTITPLVLYVATMLNAGSQIRCYQSLFFEQRFTNEMQRLVSLEGANFTFTPSGSSLESSIQTMRERMFESPIQAAFFVGGMDGIRQEYSLLRTTQPGANIFAFTAPGGAAASLDSYLDFAPAGDVELNGPRRYPRSRRQITMLAGRAYASLALASLEELEFGSE